MTTNSKIDMTGVRVGRWTVLGEAKSNKKAAEWHCRCDCGTLRTIPGGKLRSKRTLSCGCRGKAISTKPTRVAKPFNSLASTRSIWLGMNRRCSNPSDKRYASYGGRGIAVCRRWMGSFEDFVADMGPRPSPSHSLDRRENDGPYSIDNCRWATRVEQARNTTKNRGVIRSDGAAFQTIAEAAETVGISRSALRGRVERGTPAGGFLWSFAS